MSPSANLLRRLDELAQQFDALTAQLEDPAVLADHRKIRDLSIKRSALEDLVTDYRALHRSIREAEDLRSVIAAGADPELVELAESELPALESSIASLADSLQTRLLTADDRAVASVILEVRAGVGGDEAALFAGDLLGMYTRFAASRGWSVEELELSPGEVGGIRSVILSITGPAVWSELGYEGGTHQVKRVPATEAQGRVHTSTATVAVLPEPEEVEVKIAPDDVKEILTTAQGPGGQNVNKVATAVHLIHIPTGIEVRMQETRSQGQNREKAWKLLRARLFERQQAEANARRTEARNAMIGGGGRAEKIRTYRWKENIVVDHRLRGQSNSDSAGEESTFNLSEIIAGKLDDLITSLQRLDIDRRLAAL